MATKKKKDEERLVIPGPAENFNDVPELYDTIEEAVVTGERGETPRLEARATTSMDSGLAGEPPTPSRPLQTPTAPATTDLGNGLAMRKPAVEDQPAVNGSLEPQATQEAQPAPAVPQQQEAPADQPAPAAPQQESQPSAQPDLANNPGVEASGNEPAGGENPEIPMFDDEPVVKRTTAPAPAPQQEAAQPAEQASQNDAPAASEETPSGQQEAPQRPAVDDAAKTIEQEAERIGQESMEPKPREIPVKLSPEELVASQRAAADAILREPTNTAEAVAATQGAAALEENKPDAMRESFVNTQEAERQSFADLLQGMRDEYDRERDAAQAELKADSRAARFTGYTELGSAIANLIGVAEGNAVSQVYKPVAQDWMKKADQDMREHRTRIDNLRQRQRDTELKMSQLKSQMNMERMKFDMQREKQRYENELQKARIAYETARTEAARQKAQQDAAKADKELARIQAQIEAYEAQARQRDASARASLSNAATRRLGQENTNRNRDITAAAQADANTALAESRRNRPASGRASGSGTSASNQGNNGNQRPIGSYF